MYMGWNYLCKKFFKFNGWDGFNFNGKGCGFFLVMLVVMWLLGVMNLIEIIIKVRSNIV